MTFGLDVTVQCDPHPKTSHK